MMDQVNWLIEWFCRGSGVQRDRIEDQLETNYFEAGFIDSLGVIELITDIEKAFEIEFNEEHFQERRFSTIAGLAALIEELSEEKRRHIAE